MSRMLLAEKLVGLADLAQSFMRSFGGSLRLLQHKNNPGMDASNDVPSVQSWAHPDITYHFTLRAHE